MYSSPVTSAGVKVIVPSAAIATCPAAAGVVIVRSSVLAPRTRWTRLRGLTTGLWASFVSDMGCRSLTNGESVAAPTATTRPFAQVPGVRAASTAAVPDGSAGRVHVAALAVGAPDATPETRTAITVDAPAA